MAANVTDKFKKVGTGTVTTLAAPGKALGAISINVGSTANYPQDTGIIIAMRTVDANGALIAGTYTEWSATVSSATSLAIVATPVYGSDQIYSAGASTQVYIPTSSYSQNTLIDGILAHANQDGTLKANSVGTTQIADGAITSAKMAGAQGTWNTAPALTWVSSDGPTSVLKATGVDVREAFNTGVRIKADQVHSISNYWSFDTNSADSKGSAVMGNIGTPTYTAGKFGNALTLNGSDQALSVTDGAAFHLGASGAEFTVGAWFKTSATGASKCLYQSWSKNPTNGAGIQFMVGSGNVVQLYAGNNTSTSANSTIVGTTVVTDGNWHYAVATFRNNFCQIYLDGKLEASGYCITPVYVTTYTRIGCLSDNNSNAFWFNGQIDDLFLINGYALDEQTIAAKYAASTAQGTADITVNKKALCSAEATMSGSDTLITVYTGTDYAFVNSAITNPYYSALKAPYGFPLKDEKWTVEYRNNVAVSQSSPVQNQWYNLGSQQITVPVGTWRMYYRANIDAVKTNAQAIYSTLSLANNSETEPDMSSFGFCNSAANESVFPVSATKNKTFSSKTVMYFNIKTDQGATTTITCSNSSSPSVLRATSTLL